MSDTQTPNPEVVSVEPIFQVKEFSPELMSAILNLSAAFRNSPCVKAVTDVLDAQADEGDEQALNEFAEAVFHHSVMRLRTTPIKEHEQKLTEAVAKFQANTRVSAPANANILREQMTLALGTLVQYALTHPTDENVLNGNFEAFQSIIENNYRRANMTNFLTSVQASLANTVQKAFRMPDDELEASDIQPFVKEAVRNIRAEAKRTEDNPPAQEQDAEPEKAE